VVVLKYRAEIDGLRALAVVPVVLFHAGFKLFSGGFVGVDVFFVISGYLITTILIEDIENKQFSIVRFYERRARRILPALFLVMLVCIPFAWMWLLPSQMKDFSRSLVAVSLFASNIFFWQNSGYFEASAEEKPLLHTWSLAVEEQYYVLFPIFLFLTWRFGKNRVFWTIVIFAAISLTLSEWGWRNKATANFYLAPTRAWELFAGSIAAFILQKRRVKANNALSFLGLAAITFAIFAYDERTPFPSVYTLVPVIGVVLLVLFSDKETYATKPLCTKFFVGIGLISYSAYLWHQPLFAFARVYTFNQINLPVKLLLIFTTFLFAYLSWRFVESPFRKGIKIGRKKILLFSIVGMVAFTLIGVFGYFKQGFDERWGAEAIAISNAVNDWEYPGTLNKLGGEGLYVFDSTKPINILFFGDSHAEQFAPLSKKIFESTNKNVGFLADPGCPPIPNLLDDLHPQCFNLFDRLHSVLATNKSIKTIVIAGCFNCYFIEQSCTVPDDSKYEYDYYYKKGNTKLYFRKGEGQQEALLSLRQFATNLSLNMKVLVIADNPHASSFDPNVMMAYIARGDSKFLFQKYSDFSTDIFAPAKELISLNDKLMNLFGSNISVVDSLRVVCEDRKCEPLDDSGNPKYNDTNHMRPNFVRENFSELIIESLK
jgi:peptidoglycan/LPS O-acetylase OafA/YrhL